ncbi:hypothetical protein ACFFJT_02970 [Dyella flava]|nr:hypothetical protein [Dyella flava]
MSRVSETPVASAIFLARYGMTPDVVAGSGCYPYQLRRDDYVII